MFITYNPITPNPTKEIQYILDGSDTLENIQGRMVLPLPKGVNPLDVYSASDITKYDPIVAIRDVLGYDKHLMVSLSEGNYWNDQKAARTTFISSTIKKEIFLIPSQIADMSTYSVVACLGSFSSDGYNFTAIDPKKIIIHTEVTRDPDGPGPILPTTEGTKDITTITSNPKILPGYSTPFVFVTTPDPLTKNPTIASLSVSIKYNSTTPVNLLYFAVMYNS